MLRFAPPETRGSTRVESHAGSRGSVDLTALYGLRVVLTAWLVVHHTTRWLLRDGGIDPDSVALLRQGQGATTGFIIMSGLVLTWRWSARLAAEPTIPRAASFLRRRWAAIWPIGAFGALVAVPYELVEQRLAPGEFVVGLVANITLVQSWLPIGGGAHGMSLRFDGPTWTLSTLLALYAAFPVIAWGTQRWIRSRRSILALGVVPWLLVVATGVGLSGEPGAVWLMHVSPLARAADFLVGVAIGTWLLRYGPPRMVWGHRLQLFGAALVVLAAWMAVELGVPRELRFGALYIPPLAVLMLGLTVRGGALGRVLALPRARRAGTWAFSIAMLHTPVIGLGWHAGLVSSDRPIATLAVVASTVPLALFVHAWIEKPARERLDGRRDASRVATVGTRAATRL